MDFRKTLRVEPGSKVRLADIDPADVGGRTKETALLEMQADLDRVGRLQNLLYADGSQALLIVLQALDAGGKDGVVRHLSTALNPAGATVASFKTPTPDEAAHDFLWRVHARTPAKGDVAIFNRSHYEDVLYPRVHGLITATVLKQRYEAIVDFERELTRNRTSVLKFYLHIGADEQLARFKTRLDDPARQWKISESDYTERALWPKYVEAFQDAVERTSTAEAPWYVVPANHKWYRNLAVTQIIANTLDEMGLKVPAPRVDLAEIRRKYHAAKISKS
jgi:PPK2 family polyphosphate:nucleotide phosphotransferase